MNNTFGKPVIGSKARLSKRVTMVTPPVVHALSEYKSLGGMRSHYCFLIIPGSEFIYF